MNTIPTTNITVAANTDSVKVAYQPVAGAKDYRLRRIDGGDGSSPNDYKCAGMWHLDADQNQAPWYNTVFAEDASGNPTYPLTVKSDGIAITGDYKSCLPAHHADIPALEIEWNGLTPGQPATLILEALDALGPVDYQALYQDTSTAINQRINPTDDGCDPAIGKCALGSNMGCEYAADQVANGPDVCVTNGQGPGTNNPNVIAASAPFVVTPTGKAALPSSPAATQVFFDTFAEAPTPVTPTVVSPGNNAGTGIETGSLTTPAGKWDISTKAIDTVASTPAFVNDNHLMGVIFDSDHVGYGSVAYSPEKTADISAGQILHMTCEVDTHTDGRRWASLAITPATDPLTGFELPTNPGDANVNATGEWVFFQWQGRGLLVNQGAGIPAAGGFTDNAIVGAAGQATYNDNTRPFQNYQYGHGLDNRSRLDVFVSQTEFAVYEDGKLICQHAFPTPLSFSQVKAYFNGYMYHSSLEQQEIVSQGRGYETYWLPPFFSASDERHWDNMGFEVLPASTPWASLGSLITMPAYEAATPAPTTTTGGTTDPLQAQLDAANATIATDAAEITTLQGELAAETVQDATDKAQAAADAAQVTTLQSELTTAQAGEQAAQTAEAAETAKIAQAEKDLQ